jgi:outer membrane protein assembly factor BamB
MRHRGHWIAPFTCVLSVVLAMMSLASCESSVSQAPRRTPTPTKHLSDALGAKNLLIAGNQSNQNGPATFVALDAQTGQNLWSAPLGLTYTTPALANGVVYMTSKDGWVYALQIAGGAASWKVARGSLDDGYPTVANGVVYITSDSGSVLALDAATGKQRWSYQAPNANDHVYSAPAVGAGLVYVASGGPDNGLVALDAASGARRWSASTQGDAANGQPVVANGAVYLTDSSGEVYAFDATSGKSLWKVAASTAFQAGPAVADGHVFVGGEDGVLHALDATSGQSIWTRSLVGQIGLNAAPAVANGVVYVGGSDSRLSALNAATGAILWQKALHDSVTTTPVIAEDGVFVGDQSGNVYGLLTSDGGIAWTTHIANIILASAVVG